MGHFWYLTKKEGCTGRAELSNSGPFGGSPDRNTLWETAEKCQRAKRPCQAVYACRNPENSTGLNEPNFGSFEVVYPVFWPAWVEFMVTTHTKDTFSGTKFFRYRFRDFFPVPIFSDTGSSTTKKMKFPGTGTFTVPIPIINLINS